MKGDSLVAAKEAIWNKYEYELPIPLITSRYKEVLPVRHSSMG